MNHYRKVLVAEDNVVGEAQQKKQAESWRDEQGRLMPGHPYAWGADNPPPKSPGAPKKSAWVKALEEELASDPKRARKMAERILRIAEDGERDADSLTALREIEDRIGGPVTNKVEVDASVVLEERRILIVGTPGEAPQLPPEILALEEMRALAEDAAQVSRKAETEKEAEKQE